MPTAEGKIFLPTSLHPRQLIHTLFRVRTMSYPFFHSHSGYGALSMWKECALRRLWLDIYFKQPFKNLGQNTDTLVVNSLPLVATPLAALDLFFFLTEAWWGDMGFRKASASPGPGSVLCASEGKPAYRRAWGFQKGFCFLKMRFM